ncbi:MAG: S9 family peptidase, partial [Flavobacteriales bacterium]|nr:S9 family peptidase [Flavobacteriales bacterium]
MKHLPYALAAMMLGTLVQGCAEQASTDEQTAEAPPPRIDMELFFKNPEKASFRVSPDGTHISYRAPWMDRMNIFVRNMATGEETQVTKDTIRDIGGYFWKGDRIIYSRDINGDENYIVFSAAIDGSDAKALTPEQGVRAGTLDDLHNIEGMEKHIIVQMNERNPEVFDPYLINVETGERKQLVDNSRNFQSWQTDHAGVIRLATITDGVTTTLYHRATENDPFEPIKVTDFKDDFSPLFFTFDNKNLFVNTNLNGRDKSAIVEYDIANDKEVREVFSNGEYDAGGLDYSKKRKVLTMAYYTGWKQERQFLDEETKAMYEAMAPKFEGYEFWIYGEDDSETKFIVWAGNDRMPGKYYYYDHTSGDLTELATLYPWLNEEHMAEMKPIQYTSRDGLTIHGY